MASDEKLWDDRAEAQNEGTSPKEKTKSSASQTDLRLTRGTGGEDLPQTCMNKAELPAWRLVSFRETEVEKLEGKTHFWHCRPGMTPEAKLMFVRAQLLPGHAHPFHYHPGIEEVLYILSGEAEQWIEGERRVMKTGDSLYLPPGIVHGTYNTSGMTLDFLAVLSPTPSEGPVTVEVAGEEPWKSTRPR
jgi:quercetin dioxygenase-like cupin family protein